MIEIKGYMVRIQSVDISPLQMNVSILVAIDKKNTPENQLQKLRKFTIGENPIALRISRDDK